MDVWEVLQDELERYKSSALAVRHCTNTYEARCVVLIKDISRKSFDEAHSCFDEPYETQSKLAIAKYKHDFKLADSLGEFVYCFERDVPLSREYWYKNFRAGLEWPREE